MLTTLQYALQIKREREARDAMRESLDIKARAVEPPQYDNSNLMSFDEWVCNNGCTLVAYLFNPAFKDELILEEEMRLMCRIQYERQLQNQPIVLMDAEATAKYEECFRRAYRTWQQEAADEAGVREFGEI